MKKLLLVTAGIILLLGISRVALAQATPTPAYYRNYIIQSDLDECGNYGFVDPPPIHWTGADETYYRIEYAFFPSKSYAAGVRFEGVDLDSSCNIKTATLHLYCTDYFEFSCGIYLWGEKHDAPDYSSAWNLLGRKKLYQTTETGGSCVCSPGWIETDVKNVVNEIFSSAGWSANSDLAFIMKGNNFARNFGWAEFSTAVAHLEIYLITPTPTIPPPITPPSTPTVTPTPPTPTPSVIPPLTVTPTSTPYVPTPPIPSTTPTTPPPTTSTRTPVTPFTPSPTTTPEPPEKVPHLVTGRVFNQDGTSPPDMIFSGHIVTRPEDMLDQDSLESGYENSWWSINVGNFESGWAVGETLHMNFLNIQNGESGSWEYLLSGVDPEEMEDYYLGSGLKETIFLRTTAGSNVTAITLMDAEGIETAEDLANKIPNCTVIYRWNAEGQYYDGHVTGLPIANFEVKPYYPYFVSVSAPGVWTQTDAGLDIPSYNLITTEGTNVNAIVFPTDKLNLKNAEDLAQDIPNCTVIYRWNAEEQCYDGHITGLPTNNFKIRAWEPYFISVDAESSWP